MIKINIILILFQILLLISFLITGVGNYYVFLINILIFLGIIILFLELKNYKKTKEKESFKNIFKDENIAGMIVDFENGDIINVNKEACKIYNLSTETMTSKKIYDFNIILNDKEFEELKQRLNESKVEKWIIEYKISDNIKIFEIIASKITINNKLFLRLNIYDITEKSILENFMKKSREYHVRIFEKISLLVCIINEKFEVIYCNEAMKKMIYKESNGKCCNFNYIDYIFFEDRKYVIEKINKSIENKNILDIKYRLKKYDDSYSWIKAIGEPIYNMYNAIEGYLIFGYNVDAEEKYIRMLKESENKYIKLFENITFGLAIHEMIRDKNGNPIDYRFLKVNKKFEEITGLKRENIIGKTVLEVLSNTEKFWIEKYGEIEKEDKEETFENYSRELNKFYRVTAYRNEPGQFITIVTDITEEKKYMIEKKRFEVIVENAPVTIVVTDINGKIIYANPMFEKISGWSCEEAIGKKTNLLRSGVHSELFYKDLWDTINSGKTWKGEFFNKTKNGMYYWEKAIIAPVKDENNQVINFIAIKEDITELKRNIEYLEKAIKDAENANKVKSDFLANMSHELRTPLNGILGFASILKDEELNENQKEMVELIEKAGEHLLEIINNILDFSKLESGKDKIDYEIINVVDILNEIEHIFIPIIQDKKIDFIVKFSEKFNFYCDKIKFKQLMINVVGNAIKFTEKGKVEVEVRKNQNYIEIKVEDTGIGIAEEKMKKIFEPFEQGELYLTKKYGGTGLGLTIVKKIIDLLKGSIDIKSKLGEGTIVFIKIPFIEKLDIKNSLLKHKNIRALVIDENIINLKYFNTIIKNFKWKVDFAFTEEESLKKISKEEYDVILVAINLVGFNSYELIKKIREMKNNSLIIGIVDKLDSIEKMCCVQAGIDECITINYGRDELKNIEKILENKNVR